MTFFFKKEPSLFTWDGVDGFKIYESFSDSDKLLKYNCNIVESDVKDYKPTPNHNTEERKTTTNQPRVHILVLFNSLLFFINRLMYFLTILPSCSFEYKVIGNEAC